MTPQSPDPVLKACPFCGGTAHLTRVMSPDGNWGDGPYWDIDCSLCWVSGRWNSKGEAITAWNQRAGDAKQNNELVTVEGNDPGSADRTSLHGAEGKTDRAPISHEDLITAMIQERCDSEELWSIRDLARAILAALAAPVTIPPNILAMLEKVAWGTWKPEQSGYFGDYPLFNIMVSTDGLVAEDLLEEDAAVICALVNWARSVAGNAAAQPDKDA